MVMLSWSPVRATSSYSANNPRSSQYLPCGVSWNTFSNEVES